MEEEGFSNFFPGGADKLVAVATTYKSSTTLELEIAVSIHVRIVVPSSFRVRSVHMYYVLV